MRWKRRSLTAAILPIVLAASVSAAQDNRSSQDTATQVTASDIASAIERMKSRPVGEDQLRVVDVGDEYNIGVGILRHIKQADGATFAVEHSAITEIHYIISGSGALITGGVLKDARAVPPDSTMVSVLNGPSDSGSGIVDGERHLVGSGDVVIIPTNTPHMWEAIFSGELVDLVIRVDPHHVLPAGLGDKTSDQPGQVK
jgi:mannose-6-phosphate isomerase-like protein (cupin superfamily)